MIYLLKQPSTSDLNVENVDISSLDLTYEDKQLRLKAKQIYDKYLLSTKLACITTDKYRLEMVKKTKDIAKVNCLIKIVMCASFDNIFL